VVPKSAGKYLRRAKEAVSQYLPASAEAARQALRVSAKPWEPWIAVVPSRALRSAKFNSAPGRERDGRLPRSRASGSGLLSTPFPMARLLMVCRHLHQRCCMQHKEQRTRKAGISSSGSVAIGAVLISPGDPWLEWRSKLQG